MLLGTFEPHGSSIVSIIGTDYHTLNYLMERIGNSLATLSLNLSRKTISGVLAHERTHTCYHVTMESIWLHTTILVSLLSNACWFKFGPTLSFSPWGGLRV